MRRIVIAAMGVPVLAALLLGAVLTWGDAAPAAAGDSAAAGAGADAISAGDRHTCALKDGGVWCWGYNGQGQLGNEMNTGPQFCGPGLTVPCATVPVAVPGLTSGVSAISAGKRHTCALKDGGVWCWGENASGQLGNGTRTGSAPVSVPGLQSGVTAISAGDHHTCALRDGGAWCWGENAYGQLGNGGGADSLVPVAVSGLMSGVGAISAGLQHTCALKDGGAWCWGHNEEGELGNTTTAGNPVPVAVSGLASGVTAISAGDEHTCALRDGGAWCWGLNSVGELGNGTNAGPELCVGVYPCSTTPVVVSGLTSGVSDISARSLHSCALKDGGVWCWGWNINGQIGNGTSSVAEPMPLKVSGLAAGATAVSGGGVQTCALKDGRVWCWGANGSGALGDGTTTDSSVPVAVVGLPASSISAVSAGGQHACAIRGSRAWCWGANASGQLGDGSTTESHVPVAVLGLAGGVSAISAGFWHTCALIDGGVWCWGWNGYGQLGNNGTTDSPVPVPVAGLTTGVNAISSGATHTCAVKDGGAWCWGWNILGELGDGSTTDSPVPVMVAGLTSGVTAVSTGYLHTCALKDGGAWCWGHNVDGELGDNSTLESHVPVPVFGLSNGASAISAGWGFTCGVKDGEALCWGANNHGELGDGVINGPQLCSGSACSSIPASVSGLMSGVRAIGAGFEQSCALKDGGVSCWGNGMLGNGDIGSTSRVPVAVSGLASGVGEISMAGYYVGGGLNCALRNGKDFCWGYNANGELGNNGAPSNYVPVEVLLADSDSDLVVDAADNCPGIGNADQADGRREFIDLHVYGKLFDDLTALNSTTLGDACNPDIDGDGLPNDVEAQLGPAGTAHAQCPAATGPTDPLKLDTDGDGFTDRAECLLVTDPVDPASKPLTNYGLYDTDHDGVHDWLEVAIGTDPTKVDTDGDKLLDGVEFLRYGSDPLNANSDGDICSDGQEAASLNDDTNVNSTDLLIVAKAQGPKGGPKYVLDFDVNKDEKINSTDLLLVAKLQGAC